MVPFNASNRQDLVLPSEKDLSRSRLVKPSPVYAARDVETVLSFSHSIVLWTEKCNDDVNMVLGWTHADVAQLVREAVSSGRLISSEWCEQKPDGPCAPCDAYEVTRTAGKKMTKYYVKFAIARTGMALLVISCHKSLPKRLST